MSTQNYSEMLLRPKTLTASFSLGDLGYSQLLQVPLVSEDVSSFPAGCGFGVWSERDGVLGDSQETGAPVTHTSSV